MIQRIRDWFLITLLIIFSMVLIGLIWGGILSYKELPAISIFVIFLLGILLIMLLYWLFRKFMKMKGDVDMKQDSIDIAEERESIPDNIKVEVYQRSQNACENPDCRYESAIHIHHIDMDRTNNNPSNLVVLCPNCHQEAHRGNFTTSQLRNWVRMDSYQQKRGTDRLQ